MDNVYLDLETIVTDDVSMKARDSESVIRALELVAQQKAGVLITSAAYSYAIVYLLAEIAVLNEKIKILESKQ